MSAHTIAGCTLAALFAVFWLAYGAVRLWESRNASYTASEWLEAMRKLPPLPPPRRTQEGRENLSRLAQQRPKQMDTRKGVKGDPRPRSGKRVAPVDPIEQIAELERML